MVAVDNYVNDYLYDELEKNYDPIYEALIAGGVVCLKINYSDVGSFYSNNMQSGYDGYVNFMVTCWYMDYDGLNIVCPTGERLTFSNGSYTPENNTPT